MAGTAKTVRGEIVKVGLSGHVWGVRQADGVTVELLSPPQDLLQEGMRVEIEGDSGDDRVSIGMMGDRVAVSSWRRI